MPPSVAEPESSSTAQIFRSTSSGFPNLRGVRWRTNLGILPSYPSSSIDELRRVTADSRRRYANLRRCLLVSPHFPKAGDRSPDLVMDNPLSQNPDSMWSRFFRNAELERTVNQDLSRLYPEHESYFQSPACQAILRRIILLWCLRHPEYGYKHGMHELLAPLLYILHIDVQCLAQVRKLHEDHFSDKFDSLPFPNVDTKVAGLDELDSETNDIVLLNDAYGAEGELGVISSERFIEHDAYCMFNALMNGSQGVVAMANYYSPSPALGSVTGLPPVVEASSALYHLLSKVDSSLHSHLVELGVEPQYFALRWLRVLFGREFSLEDLLIIWDEIFISPNGFSISFGENDRLINFTVLTSPRGAFIVGMVVSMILHLRPVLLATENATSCLQRLLNFPENINVENLIEKAKSLQALAMDPSITSASPTVWFFEKSKPSYVRDHSMSSVKSLPDTYWEEKWRSLHNAEGVKKNTLRSLAQSILENIQVIESVFQQESLENLSNNSLGGKGQVMAAAALKKLRKISNILSEM
ncbi:hypothetical protein QJS04_geneDACA013962 [Acorus gramineus]|uniref:Rab-GAP TBC domain-containing protein n=1 Tax=Acorus gramineus TaxID=55184 RepID=A0AAV9AVI2_ACOGR|nr:hypothetical protein QJS04_geneDACA013962 [Acorus gramineus]